MSKHTFNPTQKQINASANVFVHMALLLTLKPRFDALQYELFKTNEYQADPAFIKLNRCGRINENGLVTTPDAVHLIAGTMLLGTDEYIGSDAERYYKDLRTVALKEGFVNGENAVAVAKNDLNKAENEFLKLIEPITNIEINKVPYEMRQKLIDLSLKMFSRLMTPTVTEPHQIIVFCTHMEVILPHNNNRIQEVN